jgi:angio-associated migratory cell protein
MDADEEQMNETEVPFDDNDNDDFQEQEEDEDGEAFIDYNDAEEVIVDDDNMPMDDDDDDDEEEEEQEQRPAVPDMSQAQITSHTDHVYAVAAHLDPASGVLSILSGAGDDTCHLHKIAQGGSQVESKLLSHKHTDSVSCVAFNYHCRTNNEGPKYAAVGGYDGAILIYDPDTGALLQPLEGPSDIEWLAWHPKGGTVLLAGSMADGTIWMYHIVQKTCLQVFCGHESGVTAGSFSPDGKWALSASQDGTCRVWAPRTGVCKHVFSTGDAGLTSLAIGGGSDGQLIMVGAEDGAAHVCHIGTKKIVAALKHFEVPLNSDDDMELPMSVEAVAFCKSNPHWCATGGVDGVLKIWDLANAAHCRQSCTMPNSGGVTRMVWHHALPLVVCSYSDGSVGMWDARNGRLLTRLTGCMDMINDLALAFVDNQDDAIVVVVASDDKTVRVFHVNVKEVLQKPTTLSSPSSASS